MGKKLTKFDEEVSISFSSSFSLPALSIFFPKLHFLLKIFHTTKVGDFSQSLERNIYWYDNFTSNYESFPWNNSCFLQSFANSNKVQKRFDEKKELLYSRVWNKYNPFIVWTKYCAGTVLKTNGLNVSYFFQVAPFLLKGYSWFVIAITKYEWPRKRPHFCRASLFIFGCLYFIKAL